MNEPPRMERQPSGDWTATGLPATIEGAILSGRRAAESALA